MNGRRFRLVAIVGTLVALSWALVGPVPAMAYIEGTLGARVANEALAGIIGPMGCIQQGSGLTHSGGDDPITVNASAMPAGLTAGTAEICNQVEGPGLWKIIKGRMVVSLVKLRSPGNSSTPDDYYTCRNIFYNQRSWSTRLNMQHTFSTPPCGAGYYAVISCLQDTDIALTDLVLAFGGRYNPTTIKDGCNHSPNWHPAIDGMGRDVGPRVRLR